MVEPPLVVFRAVASSHHEDADFRFEWVGPADVALGVLEPTIEPLQPPRLRIGDRRRFAEVHLAVRRRALSAVNPRAHDQVDVALELLRKGLEVGRGVARFL